MKCGHASIIGVGWPPTGFGCEDRFSLVSGEETRGADVSEDGLKRRWVRTIAVVLAIGVASVAWAGCGDSDNEGGEAQDRIERGLDEAREGLESGADEAQQGIEEGREEAEQGIEGGRDEAGEGVEQAEDEASKQKAEAEDKLDDAKKEAAEGLENAEEEIDRYTP
jgi:vacuolar-type H+-ATPase subunit H